LIFASSSLSPDVRAVAFTLTFARAYFVGNRCSVGA
jgi:hypothetical protein